jgi:hypothetical protein
MRACSSARHTDGVSVWVEGFEPSFFLVSWKFCDKGATKNVEEANEHETDGQTGG